MSEGEIAYGWSVVAETCPVCEGRRLSAAERRKKRRVEYMKFYMREYRRGFRRREIGS